MLESALKEQLKGLFSELTSSYTLHIEIHPEHPKGREMVAFLEDVAECSNKIECKIEELTEDESTLQFHILRDSLATGIIFRAIPNGHEFTSLVIAILNLDGKGKNLPDDFTAERIKAISGMINITTYMSLTCPNCPDVVQALNIIAMLNGRITHEVVDGALFKEEVEKLNIQSVPTVYADGELLHVGRGTLADLLGKLDAKYGSEKIAEHDITRSYDIAIAGGGPSGATAAIYLARKGLKVAIVAEKVGGQVNETLAIENIPSVIETTGSKLAQDLHNHMLEYPNIDILENRTIESIDVDTDIKRLHVMGGELIEAPQLIITMGAQWLRLNVDGESEYIGRGVAFCAHCDGPLFEGKRVAVVGGGNSGAEAAIELSEICERVTIVEFAEQLKADEVLRERIKELPNVEVYTNHQTTSIIGDGSTVVAIEMKDRASDESKRIDLDGVFVQIGFSANSALVEGKLERNERGEISVDRVGRTSTTMVYAAGDVTNVNYKQIVIAMGEGAKAALAAFDDRIRR